MEFRLCASLQGHEDDVRAVAFLGEAAVVSASRDATVRLWKRAQAQNTQFEQSITSHGTEFVNSIAYVTPSPEYPDGLIISGGKDALIEVRQPGRPPESDPERVLLGHEGNICTLDVSPDPKSRYLVSGSWDASARIWDISKGESTATLDGHEGSVWAVLAFDGKTVITGCADKQIRIFSTNGKLIRTIKGSADVVRALCRLPENASAAQFASAGNDSVIRLWMLDGTQIAELHGHENFIYSIAALPSGELVSSSEDRSVRIWRENTCVQTITHPAISVWSVGVCSENGDIASGASDRIVRVFSRSKERQADPEVIQAFEDSVKASAIPKQQMPEINKEKLPGPEFLQQKSGTKEGQVQMIREQNGNISAHQWSMASQEWINVGTVVDSAGSSGRTQQYLGQDYDYVFDVDIEDGKPPLKLPYNLSQNPYEVARQFIGENELPITYFDQIAQFIIKNTQGATIGQGSGSETATATDPSADPQSPQTRAPPFPQREYLAITTANYPMMFKKIVDLNQKLLKDGRKDLSLSPGDLQIQPNLVKELESATSGSPKVSQILDTGVDVAVKISTQWPAEHRLPGLDLLRCLCAATPAVTTRHNFAEVIAASEAVPTTTSTNANANTAMLAFRGFVNLFRHPEGRALAIKEYALLWGLVRSCLEPPSSSDSPALQWNRNVHIAAATLAINYAVLLAASAAAIGPDVNIQAAEICRDLADFMADPKVVDSETLYRALVAVGTLMHDFSLDALQKASSKAGLREAVMASLSKVEKGAKEPRIKGAVELAKDLL